MKWVWIALAIVLGIVVVVAVVGALLPVKHSATRRIVLRQPAAAVWAAITDVMAMLPPRDGKRCWREVSGFGPMDLMVEHEDRDRKLVGRIITEGSPFGGTWTYVLRPVDGSTELAITEDGEIYNVMFRSLARFVFGYTSTIDGYPVSLAKKFGEDGTPGD